MTIIPAIDIIDGKAVRLTRGDFDQKTIYNDDPLEVAKHFEGAGLKRLHLVDLDGAREGKVINWGVLERIAQNTKMIIDFSGGISSRAILDRCFSSGANFASIGSMAIKNELLFIEWLQAYGPNKFIIAADVKDEIVVVKGWTEVTTLTVFDLIENYSGKGVQQYFCTDVNMDGLLQGPSVNLYKKILNEFPSIDLIASGGVSTIEDIETLRQAGCSGVIIGKAFYENRISLPSLARFII